MLEHQNLVVLACSIPKEATSARRDIFDRDTGQPVGHASWNTSRPAGWLGIFLNTGPTVEVRETEDNSLLFTMHGSSPWQFLPWMKPPVPGSAAGSKLRWEIRDADGYLVGTLEPAGQSPYALLIEQATAGTQASATRLAYDACGRCVVFTRQDDGNGRALGKEIVAVAAWTEIASMSACEEGGAVHFSAALESQPFTKMLIVAAAVVGWPCYG